MGGARHHLPSPGAPSAPAKAAAETFSAASTGPAGTRRAARSGVGGILREGAELRGRGAALPLPHFSNNSPQPPSPRRLSGGP